jgi:signal transduction histidine kinase
VHVTLSRALKASGKVGRVIRLPDWWIPLIALIVSTGAAFGVATVQEVARQRLEVAHQLDRLQAGVNWESALVWQSIAIEYVTEDFREEFRTARRTSTSILQRVHQLELGSRAVDRLLTAYRHYRTAVDLEEALLGRGDLLGAERLDRRRVRPRFRELHALNSRIRARHRRDAENAIHLITWGTSGLVTVAALVIGLMVIVHSRREARVLRQSETRYRSLAQRLEKSRGELAHLLSHIVTAQEEERQRIAADVHDDLIQKVTAVSMRLDMLEMSTNGLADDPGFVTVRQSSRDLMESMRQLMFDLRPYMLDSDGLAATVRLFLKQEAKSSGKLTYHFESDLNTEPPGETRVILYRLTQESLRNVRKHGKAASRAEIYLGQQGAGYVNRIMVDGGFDVGQDNKGTTMGVGLAAMRERAELAGGWFKADVSSEGRAVFEFWLPNNRALTVEAW